MIKVNLLRDAGRTQAQSGSGGTRLNIKMPNLGDGGQGPLIQRMIIFIAPIIFVYGYGWYIDYDVQQSINAIKVEISQVDAQADGYKTQLESIEKLNTEKNKISAQVNSIKELSKQRYGYVKVMDALQTLIPEKAWLTKVTVKDKNVMLEGRANTDSTISNFMQNLEESAYFRNVTWDNSREVSEPQGTFKMFGIHFTLENL